MDPSGQTIGGLRPSPGVLRPATAWFGFQIGDRSAALYRAELYEEAISYQTEKGSLDAGFYERKAETGDPIPTSLSRAMHEACSTGID